MTENKRVAPKLENVLSDLITYPSGMEFLRYLYGKTGYSATSAVIRNGVIDKDGTIWNEARRAIWVELRSAIPPEARKIIE